MRNNRIAFYKPTKKSLSVSEKDFRTTITSALNCDLKFTTGYIILKTNVRFRILIKVSDGNKRRL